MPLTWVLHLSFGPLTFKLCVLGSISWWEVDAPLPWDTISTRSSQLRNRWVSKVQWSMAFGAMVVCGQVWEWRYTIWQCVTGWWRVKSGVKKSIPTTRATHKRVHPVSWSDQSDQSVVNRSGHFSLKWPLRCHLRELRSILPALPHPLSRPSPRQYTSQGLIWRALSTDLLKHLFGDVARLSGPGWRAHCGSLIRTWHRTGGSTWPAGRTGPIVEGSTGPPSSITLLHPRNAPLATWVWSTFSGELWRAPEGTNIPAESPPTRRHWKKIKSTLYHTYIEERFPEF